jgi:hypothetical protein
MYNFLHNSIFVNKKIIIIISLFVILLLSLAPIIFKFFIVNNYNDLLFIDGWSAESVQFYLSKSYSLIHNLSFFFKEYSADKAVYFSTDLIPNIILAFFILFAKQYATLFLNITFTFGTYSLLYYFLKKKFSLTQSLLFVVVIICFHGIGPHAVVQIYQFIFLKDPVNIGHISRYYAPSFIEIFLLLYLFFLNKAYQKNNYFGLYIFTIINFFSYFFYSLIVILCNGLLSIVKLKKKNFHNKLIFFLNFLSIVYLYFCYLIYLQLQSNLNNQGFNLDLQNINLYNFLNLRDFHVSIFLLFLLFFLNYKKLLIKNSSIDSKKIILIYLVTSVLYIVDFFVNIQISDHISRYFVRNFNWFVVLFIFFKLSFFSKLKIKATQTWGILFKDIVFVFIIFYLFASYLANTYLFYKRNNEIYAQDYQNQTNIINDLKVINIFIKNNSLKKNVFIDDAYTNVIASSILQSLNGEDYSLYNPSIFRTYSLNLHDSLILFTDQCFFFNLTKFECYEDFVNYSNNQYLNNSFLFYANRNLNFKDFENIYYLNIDRINKLDDSIFIISKSNSNYLKKIYKLEKKNIIYLNNLILSY